MAEEMNPPPVGSMPRLLSAVFLVVLVGTALDAYSVAGVPLPWLAQVTAIGAVLPLLLSRPRQRPPGFVWYALFLLWASGITAGAAALGSYAELMPSDATTPYPLFLALRVMVLVSFASFLLLVWRLLELGRERDLLRWTTLVGTAVALFAIYVYFAHVHGWPELARTRMGTGGGEQSVRFTFEFHRALGTFREPSHLAVWLTIPLFASLAWSKRTFNAPAIVMVAALLLSGSTTGVLAAAAGTVAGVLVGRPFQRDSLRTMLAVAVSFACGAGLFRAMVVPYDDPRAGVLADAPVTSVLHRSRASRPAIPFGPRPTPEPQASPRVVETSAAVAATPPPASVAAPPPPPAVAAPSMAATPTPPAQDPVPTSPSPSMAPTFAQRRDMVPTAAATESGFWDVLERRASDLASKGLVAGTNRDYVLRFVVEEPPGWLGVGLGNANLLLSRSLKSPLVVSYLSLYLNVAYAAGLAGAALLLAFLAHPLVATLRRGSRLAGAASLPLVAAYVAALVAFAGAVEELTLPFALAYALLAWHSRRHADAPRTARPADASASA